MQADGAQDEGQDGRQARQARADDADVDLDGGPQRGQRVALARVAAADGAVEAVERPEADDGDDAAAFFCCIVSVSFEVWEGRCMCVCVWDLQAADGEDEHDADLLGARDVERAEGRDGQEDDGEVGDDVQAGGDVVVQHVLQMIRCVSFLVVRLECSAGLRLCRYR